jgi:hypothetical protein
MVSHYDLSLVARHLKSRLGSRAFVTIPRMEVTNMLRSVSGQESTRIKSVVGDRLDQALLSVGVRCVPTFASTSTGDEIRLMHSATVLGELVDLLQHPSAQNDPKLGAILAKIKGQWDWSRTGMSAGDRGVPLAAV